jgi:hypothetical protein
MAEKLTAKAHPLARFSQIRSWVLLALSLATFSGAAALAADKTVWELRVTTATVDGSCLLRQAWLKVGGRFHHWELVRIDDPSNYTGKVGEKWQFIRYHRSSFLSQTDSVKQSNGSYGNPFFYLEALEEGDLEIYRRLEANSSVLKNPYTYVDQMRKDLKRPKLIPAIAVQYVAEKELNKLNRINSYNPFNENLDGEKAIVPIAETVCDVTTTYLMRNAKARYKQSLTGTKTLISNETLPLAPNRRSFAEEWIEAH